MPPKENKKENKKGLMTDFLQVQSGSSSATGVANEDEKDKEETRPNKRKCPGDPGTGEKSNLVTPEKTSGEKDETSPNSSRKDLKAQIIFYKKAYDQSEAMLEEKKNELESSNMEVKELLEKVEKLAADKAKDEKKIKTLEKELDDIQTEVKDTTGFILELKKEKATLEENLKTAEKEKDDSSENLATALAQNEELTIKLTSLDQLKADLESEEESARQRRANLKLLCEARSKNLSNEDDMDGTNEVNMEESSNSKQEPPSNVVLITTPCTGAGAGKNAGNTIPIHVQALNFHDREKKAFLDNYKISKKTTTAGTSEGKDTAAGTSEGSYSTWKSRKWCNKGENCRFGPDNCRYRHADKGNNKHLQNKTNIEVSSRRDILNQQTPAERKGNRTWLERNKGLKGRSCSKSAESSMDPGGKNEDPCSVRGDKGKMEILMGSRPNVLACNESFNKTSTTSGLLSPQMIINKSKPTIKCPFGATCPIVHNDCRIFQPRKVNIKASNKAEDINIYSCNVRSINNKKKSIGSILKNNNNLYSQRT